MSDLKAFKKRKKKLKQDIKATEAHLARLKQELRHLRQTHQHQLIDEELDHWMEKPSLFKNLMNLFKR